MLRMGDERLSTPYRYVFRVRLIGEHFHHRRLYGIEICTRDENVQSTATSPLTMQLAMTIAQPFPTCIWIVWATSRSRSDWFGSESMSFRFATVGYRRERPVPTVPAHTGTVD